MPATFLPHVAESVAGMARSYGSYDTVCCRP